MAAMAEGVRETECLAEDRARTAAEPSIEGAFSSDGVDLTLIRWMLQRSPTERLQAAQDLIDTSWELGGGRET
jgi:hypothetical protein